MSEKFCLKWNDFHSNVSKSFGLFRNEDYLHDVTLVSDDHHQMSAHKLVLSACSEYFKDIFKNNNKSNAQTILCLDGIATDDLKNIMDYIYNGEVNIFQDGLDRFLGVAQRLKLEGLMGNDDTGQEVHYDSAEDAAYSKEEENTASEKELRPDTDPPYIHVAGNKTKIVNSHIVNGRQAWSTVKVDKIMVPISSEDVSEVKERVQQYIERDADGNVKCTICGKEGKGKNPGTARCVLEKHIETHLEGLSYPCQLCGKSFRSINAFGVHKTRFHR